MTIAVKKADVLPLVNATFPTYRGRKIRIEPTTSVTLFDLNWSGGSRSEYRTCTLDGQFVGSASRYNQAAPWSHTAEGKSVDIPPGAVVVRHSIFCGRDTGLTLYVRPEDLPKWIEHKE